MRKLCKQTDTRKHTGQLYVRQVEILCRFFRVAGIRACTEMQYFVHGHEAHQADVAAAPPLDSSLRCRNLQPVCSRNHLQFANPPPIRPTNSFIPSRHCSMSLAVASAAAAALSQQSRYTHIDKFSPKRALVASSAASSCAIEPSVASSRRMLALIMASRSPFHNGDSCCVALSDIMMTLSSAQVQNLGQSSARPADMGKHSASGVCCMMEKPLALCVCLSQWLVNLHHATSRCLGGGNQTHHFSAGRLNNSPSRQLAYSEPMSASCIVCR